MCFQQPWFSVVIATYNRRQLVGRAIESALKQLWPGTEVIVVDNASTDATEQWVRVAYPQVRYLREELNRGPGPARERGLREARNPWVVMLDDDDMLTDDALGTVAAAISGWPDAMRHAALLFVHGNGSLTVEFALFRPEDLQGGKHCGDLLPVLQRSLFLGSGIPLPRYASWGRAPTVLENRHAGRCPGVEQASGHRGH